ncbi:MAG TPA: MucB/RseB C-terminal domain-containing protein [Limnobacter sp.]|nr:MucB/RseB C-terminal domain-containing protein [Limnobacter sp.]
MKKFGLFLAIKQLALALLLSSTVVSVQAKDTLWDLVWSSHEQAKALSYSGLLVTESGAHSQTSRLLHQSTASGEFEVLERLDGQPTRWIRHNDQIQCVIPDRKLILSERRQTSVVFPRVFVNQDGGMMPEKFYAIEELPGKRVAGRATRVLRLKPKDDLRHEYRLYLDRENKLLMRSELYSPTGEVLEQVGFKEITFNAPPVPNPELVQAGPGWRMSSTEVRTLTSAELSYDLPDIAFGFKKTSTLCRVKGADNQIHQTVYSDGLSTLSVFVQKTKEGQSMPQVPMSHGAVMSRSQVQGQHLVTVLGEVPDKTLDLFLQSVRWKSQ